MPVFVRSQIRAVRLNLSVIAALTRNILSEVHESSSDISLTFVGDRQMHRLNKRFRQKDRTTDVLAFATRDARRRPVRRGHAGPLGDVVISVPTAARQASRESRSLDEEIVALLVHGVLHLCGYDHERSRAEATRMQRRERMVFKRLRKVPRLTGTARIVKE